MAGMRVVRGGASQGGAVPLYPLRSMPFEQATAWGPALTGDARLSRPEAPGQVFITPDALRAVAWHTSERRDGGSVGFFVGRRHLDPDTKEPWVLVDAVVPIDRPVARELPGKLIGETIDLASETARAALRYVVGWYHSHHARQPVLTAAAMETHERYFADELHALVMVVTVGHDESQGAVFRPGVERGPVPFYEVFEDGSELAKYPRPTALQWRNYFTVETVKRETAGRRSGALWDPIAPPGLPAASRETEQDTPLAEAPADASLSPGVVEQPEPPPRPTYAIERGSAGTRLRLVTRDDYVTANGLTRWRRPVWFGAIVVATVMAVSAFAWWLTTGDTATPAPAVEVPPTRATPLDSASRSVTVAVRAYRDLALLFDRRQVGCERLGPALITLEDRWMAYTVVKGDVGRPLTLTESDRERALDLGVGGAEQHYLASTCPRP